MSFIIFNGDITDRQNAKVDIEDRGYQFGDGIYEVVRIYNGHPFALTAHIERFFESAAKIQMDISYSKEKIESLIYALLDKEGKSTASLYLQYSRGISVRNHVIPKNINGTLVGYLLDGERPVALMENGVSAIIAADTRWLHCDIKSISLLGNILAKSKAVEAGCTEAILHRDQIVTEGSSTNIWIVQDGELITHPANNLILNGITRQQLIMIATQHDMPYTEKSFTVTELLHADEVFLTSTTLEIVPITIIDGKKIGNGKPGAITKELQKLFTLSIEAECGLLV
ncbi:D-amino-acid transaminase [Caldibacillus lycopersici]|uniref:D-alanine aminotransferase n=1 Tax=Perspicuibacillus lycopersici TaxID=1325689 RepID=A0AAE3IVQ4_9BACI|nr:D-amino-acid transaminase [Perspicuibacillus lycopersici]MCU9614256.1 D-amino-acid transaminase [Perspicuibacillus lycopersici]